MELTIAISTYGKRIESLRSWHFDPRILYLVIWQHPSGNADWLDSQSNVRVILVQESGVAKSRNIAINLCTTKWLWFMDDDVDIPTEAIRNLLKNILLCSEQDVLIGSVDFGCGSKRKVVTGIHRSVRSLLSIGTIQLICCPGLARKFNCYFPENMGAGSLYPVCDEPVFLARLQRRAKVRFVGCPDVIVNHPPDSSGINYSGRNFLISRAMLFREVFGFPGCVLASAWFTVKHLRDVGKDLIYLFFYYKPK
jgi:hypothetical protein